jgi:hypothetical protein
MTPLSIGWLLVLAAAAPAGGADELTSLRARVGALQRQVSELVAAQRGGRLAEQRAAEIRSLVHEVLADADTRASLLEGGATAGWDKNFFIRSADGAFLLRVSGFMQTRFAINHQEQAPIDDDRWGFEMRRLRLIFSGHIVDPGWTYRVQLAADRDGGGISLTDAAVVRALGAGWSVRFGQFKTPFLREELMSATRQLAADRSLLNAEFSQDRSQGVELGWESDRVRWKVAAHDGFFPGGEGTLNTPWNTEDTEFAFTTRAEWLITGDGITTEDFTSFRGDSRAVLLGAAAHVQRDEFGTGRPGVPGAFNNDEVDFLGLTADAQIELGGANFFGAVICRRLDADAETLEQYGFVVQGGLFLSDAWEAFTRYEWGDLDRVSVDDLSIATLGVNRYFSGHQLKWTADIGYSFNAVAAPWASSGVGWRTDTPGEDGQVLIRTQFQLMF